MNTPIYIVMFVDGQSKHRERHISTTYAYLDKKDAENHLEVFEEAYPEHEWYIREMEIVPSGDGK